MDDVTAFQRASDGFMARAQRIQDDQWTASTPCTEWDVRALTNHVAVEYLWVPEMLAGHTIADVGDRFDGDVLGDKPLEALTEAQRKAVSATQEPGATSRTVHLSFGDMSGAEYIRQMAIDSTIHSWDLARGIGGDDRLDPELVDYAYADLQKTAEDWRSAGAFGPEQDAADAGVQAKLLALTGR
ncbi:MAG: TIGR03086 family protein [Candidatus Dormibacteraeota bacterium]|nr:TIGR03086 family protein [Candidatus Dormibacteraeota bacterium]MBV9524577.1 TIGR03086 family protein [Candidatus Dormibacteraeota bacterium]